LTSAGEARVEPPRLAARAACRADRLRLAAERHAAALGRGRNRAGPSAWRGDHPERPERGPRAAAWRPANRHDARAALNGGLLPRRAERRTDRGADLLPTGEKALQRVAGWPGAGGDLASELLTLIDQRGDRRRWPRPAAGPRPRSDAAPGDASRRSAASSRACPPVPAASPHLPATAPQAAAGPLARRANAAAVVCPRAPQKEDATLTANRGRRVASR
jgi:hypothetical protein